MPPTPTASRSCRADGGVERALAWLNRNRRLAKDFEASIASAESWIRLDHPFAGVAPGQACVFYQGERVLGGGWIARESRP